MSSESGPDTPIYTYYSYIPDHPYRVLIIGQEKQTH